MRTDINRPAQRAYLDFQFAFQFVENVKRVTTFAVKFVDENNHWRLAHAAHFHQLAGLLLHTLCHIDHDDNAVDSRQRAVSVFRKVLVTGSVKDVDFIVAIVESHHGSRYGDTTLLFDFHPVGSCGFLDFV